MKEAPVHAPAVHDSHRSAIAVRQNAFRSFGRVGNFSKSSRYRIERIIPGDTLESTLTLRADSAHWVENSVGVVNAFQIAGDLGAQEPLSRRMLRIAGNLSSTAVFHLHEHCASIG